MSSAVSVLAATEQYQPVNGKATQLSVEAQVINSSTMVPLRFVSEGLGADVKWDGATPSATITSTGVSAPIETTKPTPVENWPKLSTASRYSKASILTVSITRKSMTRSWKL